VPTPKCPVCGWEIKDKGQEVKVKGRTVVVCCDECAAAVKKNPAKYAGAK
jgi:ribosome-binding protein aMBF1 (putative translation factor)